MKPKTPMRPETLLRILIWCTLTTSLAWLLRIVVRLAFLVSVVLLAIGTPATAHPGRLDEHGCHTVRKAYRYVNGKELEAGTSHCHRLLGVTGSITLDGSEVLQEGRFHDHEEPAGCAEEHERCPGSEYDGF